MTRETLWLAAPPLAALVISFAATGWLVRHPHARFGRLDHPNHRSLHSAPVPRTGGLGLLAGLLAALGLSLLAADLPSELLWVAAALTLVSAVSFIDDLGHLPPLLRLAIHFAAALILLLGGLFQPLVDLPGVTLAVPGPAWIALNLLFVVWMINLYNFMDGMDGFAGGMAIIGFGALAVLGWQGGDPVYAVTALVIAAAAAGFLALNFPPARIFLGDTGSSGLGLLAAGMALWGAELSLFPLWVACLAFSPFIVDATWTLAVRVLRGEPIWEAHRSHHYQRLVLAGWSHRKTLLRSYLVMAAAAACAIAAPGLASRDQWMLLGAWAIIYLMIHFRVSLVARTSLVP